MDVVWRHRQQQTGEEFVEAAKIDNRNKLQLLLDANTSNIPDLVNYCDINGLSALHHSCQMGNLPLCDFLLRNGADATSKSKDGNTPLHLLNEYPAVPGATPLNPELYFKVLVAMLRQDSNLPDIPNNDGDTPLHRAIVGGDKEVLLMFLKFSKLDVNKTNNEGETPLFIASAKGNLDIMAILLEMGADPTIRSPQCSCLEIAIRGGYAPAAVMLKSKVAAMSNKPSSNGIHRPRNGSFTPRSTDRISMSIDTSISKEQQFLAQHFAIDTTDRMISDYACAFERHTQRGRLYITQEHICFYSKPIFSSELKIKISLNDVVAIDKTNSAFVLPDAVRIYTQTQQYFFSALFDRAMVYNTIEAVWQRRQIELARWKRSRARASSLKDTPAQQEEHPGASSRTDSRVRDGFGFCVDKDTLVEYQQNAAKQRDNAKLNEVLEKTWSTRLLPHLDDYKKPENAVERDKLSHLIRKAGIPFECRGRAWYVLSDVEDKRKASKCVYQSLVTEDSTHASQIDKDIPRTFPDHIFFESEEGRNTLRRVLIAYAARNPTLGYCQSMNYLAGCLLLFLEEEDAFWVLSKIVEDVLQDYFSRNMIGWSVDNRVFRHLMVQKMPKLFDHLEAVEFPFTTVTSSWFMCLFVNSLPPETTFRIWDCMFFEGLSVIFSIGLAIFKMNAEAIMATNEAWEIISMLKAVKNIFDCDRLFKIAFTEMTPVTADTLAKLRLKYWYKVAQDLEERFTTHPGENAKDQLQLEKNDLFDVYQLYETAKKSSGGVDGIDENAFKEVISRALLDWKLHPPLISLLFVVIDEDKDGVVGLNDTIHCVTILKKGRFDDRMRIWFKMFAKNSEDTLTIEEFCDLLKALYRFYYDNEYEKDLNLLIAQHKRRKPVSSPSSPRDSLLSLTHSSSESSYMVSPSPTTTPTRSSRTVSSSPSSILEPSVSLLSKKASMLSLIVPSSSTPSFPTLLEESINAEANTGTLSYDQVKQDVASHMLLYQKLSTEGGRKLPFSAASTPIMTASSSTTSSLSSMPVSLIVHTAV